MFGKKLDVNKKDGDDGQPMYAHSILKSSPVNNRVHIVMSQSKWKDDRMKNRCDKCMLKSG